MKGVVIASVVTAPSCFQLCEKFTSIGPNSSLSRSGVHHARVIPSGFPLSPIQQMSCAVVPNLSLNISIPPFSPRRGSFYFVPDEKTLYELHDVCPVAYHTRPHCRSSHRTRPNRSARLRSFPAGRQYIVACAFSVLMQFCGLYHRQLPTIPAVSGPCSRNRSTTIKTMSRVFLFLSISTPPSILTVVHHP